MSSVLQGQQVEPTVYFGDLVSCNSVSRNKYPEEQTTVSVAAVYDRRLYCSGFDACGIKPAVIDRRYRRNHPNKCAAVDENSSLSSDTGHERREADAKWRMALDKPRG